MRRIRYDTDALADLDEIFRYIAEDSPRAAQSVLRQIRATIEGLTEFSTGRRGRVAGTLDKVVVGQPYIVVYSIDDDDPTDRCIDILTVRHTSRRPLG